MQHSGSFQVALMWLSRLGLIGLTAAATFFALDPDTTRLNRFLASEADKVSHIFIAAGLTLLALLALPNVKARWIFLVMIALSFLVEIAQFFVGRSAHLLDLLSSLVGIVGVGLSYASAWLRKDVEHMTGS